MPFQTDSSELRQALQIIADSGLSGLTVRSFAQQLGTSASGLVYRYGSREGMLAALLRAAAGEAIDEIEDNARRLLMVGAGHVKIPELAKTILLDKVMRQRALYLALWEFELLAPPGDDMLEDLARWRQRDIAFWSNLFIQAGMDPEPAALWSSGLIAAQRLLLLKQPDLTSISWLGDIVLRLFERLRCQPVSLVHDSAWRAASEVSFDPSPVRDGDQTTSARIIAAASEIVLERGCDGISHRVIAKRAGVSLSSMTHHFATLEDILCATFQAIYRDASLRARYVPQSRSYTKDEFLTEILPMLSQQNSGGAAVAHAMESIMLRASKRLDMQPTALSLFALMGATSVQLLSAITDIEPRDRLDGHVFRLVMAGHRILLSPYAGGAPAGVDHKFLMPLFEK